MSEEFLSEGKAFNKVFHGRPLIRVSFVDSGSMASPKHLMEDFSPRHNSSLIGHKNQAKFENDCTCISRSGYRIKITRPNLMVLVSFSSAEDALFNDVKKYNTFSSQGTENLSFRFFWDTQYTGLGCTHVLLQSF